MSDEDIKSGIKRKRKNEIVAECLDNTMSVEQLLESLQTKHKSKLYRLYCQVLRQRRNTIGRYINNDHYILSGHPLNVFNPDWDGGLNSGYFEAFTHRSLFPKMITKLRNLSQKDPLIEQMRKKIVWQEVLSDYKRIMSLMSRKHKYEWINDEILHCPKQLIEIAAHYEQNPDPYFDSTYNWYYAGNGNMHHITVNGLDYILYSHFSCVYLSPISKQDLKLDDENVIKYDCGKDLHILETISSQNIIALRTRHKIYILKIQDNECLLKLENIKEMESKLPFTGLSVLEQDDNYDILMLNSLGDISCHTLCPQHMTEFFEDTGLEHLQEWSKSYVAEPKTLVVSSVTDISNVLKELRRLPDDYELGVNKFVKKTYNFNEKEIVEAFEKEEIEPGLLDIWNNENDCTKDESSLNLFFSDAEDNKTLV